MASRAELDPGWSELRDRLFEELGRHDGLAVAFSGGVDSSVLLHAASTVLGDRAVGVIADSPSLPRRELAEARALAESLGVRLVVVPTAEAEDERYRANRGDRCYFCKAALFEVMAEVCRAEGLPSMAFGEITDDWRDDRPGARAAAEFGVVAPLSAAGFGKREVRRYAREEGLEVAEKPASACLASRIPVGTEVTLPRLERIERAEELVAGLGFRVLRVRDHGSLARVEVGDGEREMAEEQAGEISRLLAPLGFREIELAVYRSPAAATRTSR